MTHHLCHLLPLPGECSEVHAKSNRDFGCACQELLLPELLLAGRNRGVAEMAKCVNSCFLMQFQHIVETRIDIRT